MILPSVVTLVAIAAFLVLGVEMLLFGITVIVPSIAVTQMMISSAVYMQTGEANTAAMSAFYAASLVAGLWFIGFVIRYARGKTIPALAPLPEYAKIMMVGIGVFLVAASDIKSLVDSLYRYMMALIVNPLVLVLGDIGSMFYAPIAVALYTVTTSYLLRAVEKMKVSNLMAASLASLIVGGVAWVTIGVATGLMTTLLSVAKELGPIYTFVSFGMVLLAVFSLRELRTAFIELRPEAIAQLPVVLNILAPYLITAFPEIYVAVLLVVAAMVVALNAGAAIAGLGLGSRRILVGAAAVNSAVLMSAIYASQQVQAQVKQAQKT